MNSWPISVEEFTQREPSKTRWPFSAAMTISFVTHGLVIAAILLWVDLDTFTKQTLTAPVFDVALSRITANRDSGRDDKLQTNTIAPIAEQVAIPDNEIQTPIIPKQTDTQLPEPTAPVQSETPTTESPSSSSSLQIDNLEITPAEIVQQIEDRIVTSPAASSWEIALAVPTSVEIPPEPESMPFSPSELSALEQQLQQWQDDFDLLDQPELTYTWQDGNQVFHASVQQQPAQNNTDLDRAIVEISTEVDGVNLSTQMAFKRLAFSHFAQLVDRWDRDVAVSEDEIYGRFHSNSSIVVAPQRRSEPKFGGKVTVASSISMRGLLRRADVFLGGLETRVTPIDLPKHLAVGALNFDETAATDLSEFQFEQDGKITFLPGGEFTWQSESQQNTYHCAPQCLIQAGDDVQLDVEGVVNGSVVIFAQDTIRVTGDLVYQNDPQKVTDAQDFLGMLSENYIEIAPPDITGPGDLKIHGALYAKRRFVVRNFRNRNHGMLSLFGSLTAGSLSATEPRYATRIDFDPRFEQQRPPNYPMTNKFELDQWDRQWQITAP